MTGDARQVPLQVTAPSDCRWTLCNGLGQKGWADRQNFEYPLIAGQPSQQATLPSNNHFEIYL